MTTELAARSARGGGAIMLGQALRVVLQVLGVIVLSRLLTPADFGIIAMTTAFLLLGDLIRDFGITTAALQLRTLTHQQASNAFWMNFTLGSIAAGLLTLCTPLIVTLFGQPALATVIPVMAVSLVLNGAQAQIQVQLARSMRFFSIAVTEVIAQGLGLVSAITVALLGGGYWALVAQLLVGAAALLVMRTGVARWLPSRPRRGHGAAQLARSGLEYGVANFLSYLASNVDTMLIGIRFGASSTGYYSRAFQILALPMTSILGPLTQVVIPTINSAVRDGRSRWSLMVRIQYLVASPVVLMFAVGSALAGELVPLVLGPGWEPSVTIFQWLAIGGAIQVFSHVSYWRFVSWGLSRQLLYYNIVTKTVCVGILFVGALISVDAVAIAYSLGLALSLPVNLWWLSKCTGDPVWPFLRGSLEVLASGIAAFASAWAISNAIDSGGMLTLLIAALGGMSAFMLVLGLSRQGRTAMRFLATMLAGRAVARWRRAP